MVYGKKRFLLATVQQVWYFMHRIFFLFWRSVLYLSLTKDSVAHCIRYANIMVSNKPIFPVYGHNPRTYTGKYVSEKTRVFAYFTQCNVCHLLAQKRKHYWTRITDIILQITNFITWQFLTKATNIRICPFSFLSIAQNIFIFGP